MRSLLLKKLFSSINVAGLALGLSACMLIFLYVFNEYNFDRFHKNGNRIFRLTANVSENNTSTHHFGGASGIMGATLKSEIPEINDYVRTSSHPVIVKTESQSFDEEALFVDKNFLSVFSFPMLSGNAHTALNQLKSVVLTKAFALKYFGTYKVENRLIEIKLNDTFEPYIVSGVTEDVPGNSSISFGILLPAGLDTELTTSDQWLGFSVNTFCVLDEVADHKVLESKINALYQKKAGKELAFAKSNAKVELDAKFALQPLSQIHLNQQFIDNNNGIKNGSKPVYSYIMITIAAFILFIACINFINLSMAGSLKRNKEIGIRKVIGGQRIQIVVQFLGESLVLCFISFLTALLITALSLDTFNRLVGGQFKLTSLFDIKLIGFYILLFILTGLIAGFYPAFVLSRHDPIRNLRSQKLAKSNNFFGKTLIVTQFVFATFLIIGSVVIYRQYHFLTNKDLGYQDDNLLEIPLGENADSKMIALFKNKLAFDPKIKKITGQFYSSHDRVKLSGTEVDCESVWVDADYLTAYQIQLIRGRDFSVNFPSDSIESVIVNEAFLKETGLNENGLDTRFGYLWRSDKSRIIGVVKDYHFQSVREKIKPLILNLNAEQRTTKAKMIVSLQAGHGPSSIASISKIFKSVVPYFPFSYNYVADLNKANFIREENWKQIISISAGLAILVSCIGLLGLTVLATENRSKEVGIRKVLGSSSTQIVSLFIGDFIKLVLFAVCIAMPIAIWAQAKWLDNFAYKAAMSWTSFIICGLSILIVAILPVTIQSFHASLKNPAEILSTD